MATAATTLWSVGVVRTYVGITGGDTSKDSILERIANGVTAFIERDTRRKFVTRSKTEIRDGDGGKCLFLYEYPVVSITSINIVRTPEGVEELIPPANYTQNLEQGKLYFHQDRLNRGCGNLTIVYSHGYGAQDAATLPADIVEAGLQLCKLLFTQETVGAAGQAQVTIGAHTISINPSWPKEIRDTIEHWRRPY